MRLIYSAAVYLQNTGNAAWLEAVGGTIAALPALLLLYGIMKKREGMPCVQSRLHKVLCAAFIPFFSFDGSSWVYALAESSSYTTFAQESLYLLYIPALLAVTLIASRGGNACGGLARAALPFTLFMQIFAITWQLDQLHPVWLTPILGSGIVPIARGSALCAGYAALYPAGLWLLTQNEETMDTKTRRSALRTLPLAGICSMLFLLLYGMLSPNIPDAPHLRSFAMERLLTGGGRTTSVHFPSLLSWYSMLIITAVFSVFCTSAALNSLFPNRSPLFCSMISALLCLLWTPVRMFWKHGEDFLVFANVIVVTLCLLILYIRTSREKRRLKNAQD